MTALPPRLGVAFPADYQVLDLAAPPYAWAGRLGIRAAALSRRGAGTPADPISFIQLTVALMADWSRSDPVPAAAAMSVVDTPGRPAQPANGLAAVAQLAVDRRIGLPGGEVAALAAEVFVPLPGSGYVAVVTAATTDPARRPEAEWTAQAVAGALSYRPAARPVGPEPDPAAVPELRFADLIPGPPRADLIQGPPRADLSSRPPRTGMIGQAAVDQFVRRPT
jgi:hypothetical protein